MLALGLPTGPLEVLCLGAHPDDIEIGCGATLLVLAGRAGLTVRGAVLTGAGGPREAEAREALPRFAPGAAVEVHGLPDGRLPEHWGAVKETLEDLGRRTAPDLVLAPRVDDAHQDHRLIGSLVTTVWRDALVLHYEIPKWDGDLGPMTHYVGFDAATARRKSDLLHESFPSQRGRDWWDPETFGGLMRLRGMECRAPAAEAFRASKVLLDPVGSP